MLKNKNAIVTGGAKGIGKEIVLSLAKNGANVVINYRSNISDELIEEVKSYGVKVLTYKCDVSDFDETKKLVDFTKEELGSVDILINNAGITDDMLIMKMKESQFDGVIDVNLKGTFNMVKHTSSIMLKQKSGKIVNISSVVGVAGNAGQANYSASKAGVIGITKSVAKELCTRGITVNAVAPGFIETDMTHKLNDKVKEQILSNIPLKKLGSAKDVSNCVLFLLTNDYITGQVINVDGGMII